MTHTYDVIFYRKGREVSPEERKKLLDALRRIGGCEPREDEVRKFLRSPMYPKMDRHPSIDIFGHILTPEMKKEFQMLRITKVDDLLTWLQPAFSLTLHPPSKYDYTTISLWIDRVYIYKLEGWYDHSPKKYTQPMNPNLERLLLLAKIIYDVLKPVFGFGDNDDYFTYELRSMQSILEERAYYKIFNINRVAWANFYSKDIVEVIGKEKFLKSGAWRIEELSDGGMLIVLTPNPRPFVDSKEYVKAKKSLIDSILVK